MEIKLEEKYIVQGRNDKWDGLIVKVEQPNSIWPVFYNCVVVQTNNVYLAKPGDALCFPRKDLGPLIGKQPKPKQKERYLSPFTGKLV